MAASGEFAINTTSTNDVTGKITWAESNINEAENKSDLTVNLIYHIYNASEPTRGSLYLKVTINGTSYTDVKYVSFSGTNDYTVFTKTITIPHDSDGSKSVAISLDYGYVAGTTGLSASSGSGTATLTKIDVGTFKVKVNGVWKRGVPWVKVNGTWKKGVAYVKVNGTWKRGT